MNIKSIANQYPLVMRFFLGFVFIWFGIYEIVDPFYWSGYVLPFVADLPIYDPSIFIRAHGVTLVILSICLFLKIYLRITGAIVVLMLLQIVLMLLLTPQMGLNEIAVRDIGLLGLALSVWFYALSEKKT